MAFSIRLTDDEMDINISMKYNACREGILWLFLSD